MTDYKTIDWSLVPEQTDELTGDIFKQVDGLRLNRAEFDNVPGAIFWVPEVTTQEAMTGWLSVETAMSLINTALNGGLRIKARGKLPSYPDKDEEAKAYANIKAHGLVVLSEAEACAYVPGARELSAQGYIRLAKKEVALGNKEKAKELFAKAMAATQREMSLIV